jgi:hypothetical protein
MKKMKAFMKWVVDVSDDFLAYLLTVAGILLSNYIPLLKSGAPIKISIETGRIVLAAAVAILIVVKQETITGNSLEAKAGRKKNFVNRMMNALSQGVMWATLVQLA